MVFIEREKWNWHNIIKVCERISKWKYKDHFLNSNQHKEINPHLNHTFKEMFWCAFLDWPAPKGGEEIKRKLRETIKRYRPNEEEWWYPEVVEYFYPRYLASKGGVFFTPKNYCELLSELALLYVENYQPNWEEINKKDKNNSYWNFIRERQKPRKEWQLKVYDPACGVGALLYTFRKYKPDCEIYGQEIEHESVLLARWMLLRKMNRFLGGGEPNCTLKPAGMRRGKIKYGNTLEKDGFKRQFHVVLCNPPFNQLLKEEVCTAAKMVIPLELVNV
ncbi:N-6 DNA methylase [endosymbiont DhMRE of Dentiscutata heterogama]|uniref:N-6 DNA methylase n=1 Tax=endosymbiont DhMRE of Dentiscutata heterogama TaxID=1609546 RepID=UPI002AD5B064|nr:N-6 DNA methylase [endosymbiont DhMRE of Dentiscutata heterogama]